MKLRFLSCAVILAAGLTACNKEEKGGITPSDVEAYMTLELVGQGGMTKTDPGEDGTDNGETWESSISKILILLCANEDTEAPAQGDQYAPGDIIEIYEVENFTSTGENGVKTPIIETRTGIYDVYVVANPPENFITLSEDISTKTITDITEKLMKSQYAKENNFLMFSECSSMDSKSGSRIVISAENDYENPATCEAIKLDRLEVKIESTTSTSVNINGVIDEFNGITKVELKGFKLLNGAKSTYLQQEWTKTKEEQGNLDPWINTLITPHLNSGSSQNDEEPGYYNHLSDFRVITKQDNDYTVAKDMYFSIPSYNESSSTAAIYCMENNPTYIQGSYTDARNGNTTGLIYQWKASVTGSDKLAGENCFYGYDGKYYATLDGLFQEYPGVFGATSNIGDDNLKKLNAAKLELTNAYAKSAGEERENAISDFRTKYNIKVYTEGIMYYTYYIKDQNYRQDPDGGTNYDLYYSVMRNTIYKLTVSALGGIGTDIPGGWNPDSDPEDPVDPTTVYMTVEVEVNPWVLSIHDNITLE